MRYKEHFSPQMRTQMTDVWKEVFNLFTDLRDEKYAHFDEETGYEWHNIKLDEYRFINIVKTLYEKLNTPNSRCLVKDFHDQLSSTSISKNRFCLEKDNQILCYTKSRITEYERNIIFGGLYPYDRRPCCLCSANQVQNTMGICLQSSQERRSIIQNS